MTQSFAFFLVEEFSHLAFSCAVEPLRIANLVRGETLYRWSLSSADGEKATCSNGSVTLVDRRFGEFGRDDRIFVLSGMNVRSHITPDLLAALRRARSLGCSIGALCSGAYILANAGLLDGCRAAVHWDFHDCFIEEFPEVALVRSVFVADEMFTTASGGTATADLMLHLIEVEHGRDLAVEVADQMVYNAVRASTAEQRVSLQSRHGVRNHHLARAIQLMADTIEAPIPPSRIAAELGISVRQLERLFGRYLNCSPKKYAMDMRLQKARHLLVQTDLTVTEVAMASGFSSAGHFTRVYRTQFGMLPKLQREKIA